MNDVPAVIQMAAEPTQQLQVSNPHELVNAGK